MSKKVQVVITLSGVEQADIGNGMTGEELIKHIAERCDIDLGKVTDPFVVVSNVFTGQYTLCADDTDLDELIDDEERQVARVVLPLNLRDA